MSTVTPQSDSNLDVTVTESDNLVCLDINPASFTGAAGTGTVTSVATGTGLTGGPITTNGTISIDSTVATLAGAQALTNKTGLVSQWTNDAGYITTETDNQTLSFANPDISISGGNSVDLSALSTTSLAFSAITSTPTTIAGYGITDAFDGVYASLTGKPALFSGVYADLSGKPTIPTNNNQLTNGAGYTTNTGTVTPTSTDTLTNKSGAISQWTNDSAYLTSSALVPYSTSAQVSALPISTFTNDAGYSTTTGTVTPTSTDTFTNKSGAISQWTNDAGYITSETDNQTLSFANPNLSISSGNTVDLSALTPDLTIISDVEQINPASGGLTISDAGQTTVQWGSNQKLKWDSTADSSEVLQWIFDNTSNDIFTGMQWRTASNRKIFRFDAISTGGTDPGDGSHETSFVVSGVNNTFKSRTHSESPTGLTFDADTINLQSDNGVSIAGSYTFPQTDGTANQVLQTDGAGNITFATVSGGGGGTLASLTDVAILNIQNNDLLMYNSTASEWQNTNLGVSVTPTLTGDAAVTAGIDYTVTISNHATYDDPAYFLEVYTGATRVVANDQVTDNQDGTLTFTAPNAGTHEIRVRCQDFGDLQSEIATKALTSTSFGGNFRYWKITGVTCSQGNWWMLANWRMYTATGQTGTAYPSNMTSSALPTPYVSATNNVYNSAYQEWKSFDSNTTGTFYWAIGSTNGPADWITIDLGATVDVKSMTITGGNGATYVPTGFELYGSATGAFSGEETLVHTASGLPSVVNQVTNIG
tara:strand:- start:36 stop:2324 length:2289 start_codon:yes stop_codon:yes gene_type:complete